jgi:hypothetical protein
MVRSDFRSVVTPSHRGARRAFGLCLALAAAAPSVALGQTIVLPPLLAKGVDGQTVANLTSLIGSEIDFSGGVDGVEQLDATPAALNTACLGSPACLAGIAREAGGDMIVAGTVSAGSGTFILDLLYADAKRVSIVRRKSFTVPNNPVAVADAMTPVVKELLTGKGPAGSATAADPLATVATFDGGEDEEEFAFESRPTASSSASQDAARRAAEAAAAAEAARIEAERQAAEEAARRRREDEARRAEAARVAAEAARVAAEAEARRLAAEEARLRAEEEARRIAAAEAARRAAPPAPAEEAYEDIQFGSSVAEMSVEEIEAAVQFASPSATYAEPAPTYAEATPSPTIRTSTPARPAPIDDFEEPAFDPDAALEEEEAIADLRALESEEEDASRRPTRQSPVGSTTTVRKPSDKADMSNRVQIVVRGGYARYGDGSPAPAQAIDFVTVGGELWARPVGGLYIFGGVDFYNRQDLAMPEPGGELDPNKKAWYTIFPINGGLAWKFGTGKLQPYVGADVIGVQYFRTGDAQRFWAVGGRARLGLDIMVVKNFGLNVNAALGGWQGSQFQQISQVLPNSGFLPQVSAGAIVAF